ncbi:hypothetical protein OBK16_08260 [Empedobacter falsenii]
MRTDKILIFYPYDININLGGPSGFIAHNLLNKSREDFVLSQDLINHSRLSVFLKKYLFNKFNKSKHISEYVFNEINAKNYKYIFFHDCETLEHCKNLISHNQVVILQSHSPELPSEEVIAKESSKEFVDFVVRAEKYSFERADIIIFPNEFCIPLYDTLNYDKSKIKYILSGAKKIEDLRKYPLDQSKINLLYIGRRNRIKGFDIVMDSFKKLTKYRDDVNLLLIGGGEQIKERNVYDLGFSSTPLNWYYSVDYVVNANRKSYFDLSVIEALSTNVKMILADNYGHEYYKRKSSDILSFDSSDINNLNNILLNKLEKGNQTNENMYLYNNELSDIKYFERFVKFKKEIS